MLTRLVCLQFFHRARRALSLVRHGDEEERQDGLGYQGRLDLRIGYTDNLARLTVLLSHLHFLVAGALESGRRVVRLGKCLFELDDRPVTSYNEHPYLVYCYLDASLCASKRKLNPIKTILRFTTSLVMLHSLC